MSALDWVICAVVLAAVVAATVYMIKNRKNGGCGCGCSGDCEACRSKCDKGRDDK